MKVLAADLRQSDRWVADAAERLLDPDERREAARATPAVRRRRVVSRAALRIALAAELGRPPRAIRFRRNDHGKPELAGGDARSGITFNVAHTGERLVIAMTTTGPIGIDIERVAPVARLDAIAERRFAPSEASAIARLDGARRLRAFHICWTRREATLKALGVGLGDQFDDVVVSVTDDAPAIQSLGGRDHGDWTIANVDVAPEIVGAVVLAGDERLGSVAVAARALRLDLVEL